MFHRIINCVTSFSGELAGPLRPIRLLPLGPALPHGHPYEDDVRFHLNFFFKVNYNMNIQTLTS